MLPHQYKRVFFTFTDQNSIEVKNVDFGDRYLVSTSETPQIGQTM